MFETINTLEQFSDAVSQNSAVLFYISTESCNVCKVLKPKISKLFEENFPKIKKFYIDSNKTPEVSAQKSVLAVPTIMVYFDGREFIRESRNLSLDVLKEQVTRPYEMIFE